MQSLVNCYEVSFHNVYENKDKGYFYVTHDRIPDLVINLGKRKTLLVAETHLRAVDCYGGGIADKRLHVSQAMWVGSISEKMNDGITKKGFQYRMVEIKEANCKE